MKVHLTVRMAGFRTRALWKDGPWKNGVTAAFPVREFWTDWKSQGKCTQNTGKLREFEIKYYLIFLYIIFSDTFKWTVYCLPKMDQVFSKENRTLKNTGKLEKYWKSQGIVRHSGTRWDSSRMGTAQPILSVHFHWQNGKLLTETETVCVNRPLMGWMVPWARNLQL